MRCGCPQCETYMIQSDTGNAACICPDCGYRCNACMGTNTVISREQLLQQSAELAARFDAQGETFCPNNAE